MDWRNSYHCVARLRGDPDSPEYKNSQGRDGAGDWPDVVDSTIQAFDPMLRACPACLKNSISPGSVLLSNDECRQCRSIVGIHRIGLLISLPIVALATVASTAVVYASFGYIYSIVLFPVPIGALGYLAARFLPLQVKSLHGEQQ